MRACRAPVSHSYDSLTHKALAPLQQPDGRRQTISTIMTRAYVAPHTNGMTCRIAILWPADGMTCRIGMVWRAALVSRLEYHWVIETGQVAGYQGARIASWLFETCELHWRGDTDEAVDEAVWVADARLIWLTHMLWLIWLEDTTLSIQVVWLAHMSRLISLLHMSWLAHTTITREYAWQYHWRICEYESRISLIRLAHMLSLMTAYDSHSVMTHQYVWHTHHYHTWFTHDSVIWLAHMSPSAHTHITHIADMSWLLRRMCAWRWRSDRDEAYTVICASHDCCDHTKDCEADISETVSGVCGAQRCTLGRLACAFYVRVIHIDGSLHMFIVYVYTYVYVVYVHIYVCI